MLFQPVTFTVRRPCAFGCCPATLGGACDCYGARGVEVEVDELDPVEVTFFATHGTAEQRADLRAYFDGVDETDDGRALPLAA